MLQVRTEDPAPYSASTETEESVLRRAMAILDSRMRESTEAITSPDTTRRYLRLRLAGLEHEVFGAIWVDNRHRVLHIGELFRGTVDGASVHPREVVKEAMLHNAAAVLFYHNHPSGLAEPSQADMQITERLSKALGYVDTRVLDHFIVGDAEVVSFAERGLI